MSIGTKILFNNINDYSNAKLTLTQQQKNFYTHDIPDTKTIKFVLSGLHDLTAQEVKAGLFEQNIIAIEVKKMTNKNPTHTKTNQSCLYLVYFEKNANVKLSDLKTYKYVMGAVVKWSPYINSRNGPTQCSRCQMYGHGNKNCHLPPRCMFCGGNHETNKCDTLSPPSTSTSTSRPPRPPKCCLCGGDHTSKDRDCPKRIEFMMMRLDASTRSSPRQSVSPLARRTSGFHREITNQNQFPALIQKNTPLKINHWFPNTSSSSQSHQRQQTSFLADHQPPKQQEHISSHRGVVNQSDELFSINELLELSQELINSLSRCQTKKEQFQVVNELTIKYLYSNNVK